MYMGDCAIPSDEPELMRRWQRASHARYKVRVPKLPQELPRDTPALAVVNPVVESADAAREVRRRSGRGVCVGGVWVCVRRRCVVTGHLLLPAAP